MGDRFERIIAGKEHLSQNTSNILVVNALPSLFKPFKSGHCAFFVDYLRMVLRKIADVHLMPKLEPSCIGCDDSCEQFQKSRFPSSIIADHANFIPADSFKGEVMNDG